MLGAPQAVAQSDSNPFGQLAGKDPYAEAENHLTSAMNKAQAVIARGDIALHDGKIDTAIDLYKQSLAIAVGFGVAYSRLGDAYAAKGDLLQAVSWYRKRAYPEPHTFINADEPMFLFNFASLLCQARYYNEAAEVYHRAHSRLYQGSVPKDGTALPDEITPLSAGVGRFQAACIIGAATEESRHVRDGLTDRYRSAVAIAPKFALAQFLLGRQLALTGDLTEARTALMAAAELDRGGNISTAAKQALQTWGATSSDKRSEHG